MLTQTLSSFVAPPPTSSPSAQPVIVVVRGVIGVDEMEAVTMGQLVEAPEDPVRLDLSKVTTLEPAAGLWLLAFLAGRLAADRDVCVVCDERSPARHALDEWRFAAALRNVAGISTDRVFARSTTARRLAPSADSASRSPADLVGLARKRGFFGLRSYRLGGGTNASQTVAREWRKWRSPLIMQMLTRLHGPAQDVSRVLVYETLANAIQHPGAESVTVMAAIAPHDGQPELSISVWDDGAGMVETLSACLRLPDAPPVRISPARIVERFEIRPAGWSPETTVRRGDWTPGKEAQPGELLLSCLFPGISQKAGRLVESVPPPDGSDWPTEGGYGLHALCRTTVKDFCGELTLRSGTLKLNLSAAADGYFADISDHDQWPAFLGNMVSIRVPLDGG